MFACVLLAGGCDRQSGGNAQPEAVVADKLDRTHKGAPLPELSFKDAIGEELELASLKGRPVLVNLWATWCAPCVKELPSLNAIANRADLDLEVVTISQDMEGPEQVQAFLDERGLAQLPGWLDPKGDLPARLGTATLPVTVLYDASGREVWRYAGDNDWTSQEALSLLGEGGATGAQ